MRHAALSVLLVVAGCGGASPPPSGAAPAPAASASGTASATAPVVAPPPSPSSAAAVTAPPPVAPKLEVRTADGLFAFVSTLCARAAAGDEAWVRAHAKLHLPGNVLEGDGKGDPQLGSRIAQETPDTIAKTPLCTAVPRSAAAFEAFVFDGKRARARVTLAGAAHRVVVDETAAHEPRLAELSFELPPPQATPKKPPKREHIVNGRALSSEGAAASGALAVILGNLRDQPVCTLRHAARYRDSGSFRVVVTKEDGQPLELRVYASTMVPASWVSCLEDQLSRELGTVFRGTPFVLEAHLMIGIPVKGPPSGDVVEMVGPAR